MLRRRFIAALPLALLAASTGAAEDKPKATTGSGQYVDMQPVALPVIVNGELLNYVFVEIRINLSGRADVSKLRAKEPFFRDALVMAGHRTPFGLPTDYQKIDEAKVAASLMADATSIAGPGLITSIKIRSQTPRKRMATPKMAAPAPTTGAM